MDQQEEVSKSNVGMGQYILKEDCHHLAVTPSRWFTALTIEQKVVCIGLMYFADWIHGLE